MDKLSSIFYTVKLGETNDIEAMRVGKWNHPIHGEIEIKEEDLGLFVKSFNDNVRGIDISIDLEHGITDKKGAAAGWIRRLDKKGNSLYANIEWTELGEEVVKSGQYKYFSPEFKFSYKDNETGKVYQNVLLGGGLTNRPFIKGMQEVVLMSEDVSKELNDSITTIKEENKVMDKELLKSLKLSEDATQEDVDKAVKEQLEKAKKLSEDNEELTKKVSNLETDKTKADAEVVKLSEQVKTLTDGKTDVEKENIKLSERLDNVEKTLVEKEWEAIETVALSEGKMTKPMAEKYKALYLKDKETAKDIITSLQPIVKLTEEGTSTDKGEGSNSIMLFENEVMKAVKEKNIPYTEALAFVEKDKPDLFKSMQKERGVR
ncbi:MAG: phage protease [Acidithiobacillus sp.]|jgi:phage I-like protein|uniref:phage protease n=1 Tax=Acidithiobacillus sp. TaxID=1872118 RepID=UPI00355D3E2A